MRKNNQELKNVFNPRRDEQIRKINTGGLDAGQSEVHLAICQPSTDPEAETVPLGVRARAQGLQILSEKGVNSEEEKGTYQLEHCSCCQSPAHLM